MYKIILVMLLAIVSGNALAEEWIEIGGGKELTIYVESTFVHKEGDRVKIWTLHNFKTARKATGRTYKSMKMQSEYNCKEETTRILFLSEYSENNGGGKMVYSDSPHNSNWRPVPPDSTSKALLEIACWKL